MNKETEGLGNISVIFIQLWNILFKFIFKIYFFTTCAASLCN